MLAGPLALACPPIELAEAEVAVGEERTHVELVREHHGFTVMAFGRLGVGGSR